MMYVKSLLAGVTALLVASVLYFHIYYAFLIRPTLPKAPPDMNVGLGVRLFKLRLFWLIALLSFALGFYWEFRRAAR